MSELKKQLALALWLLLAIMATAYSDSDAASASREKTRIGQMVGTLKTCPHTEVGEQPAGSRFVSTQ